MDFEDHPTDPVLNNRISRVPAAASVLTTLYLVVKLYPGVEGFLSSLEQF